MTVQGGARLPAKTVDALELDVLRREAIQRQPAQRGVYEAVGGGPRRPRSGHAGSAALDRVLVLFNGAACRPVGHARVAIGQRLAALVGAFGDEAADDFLAEPHHGISVLAVSVVDDRHTILQGTVSNASPQGNEDLESVTGEILVRRDSV